MKTYPLRSISLEEATKKQFNIIDCITREFGGHEILQSGDFGVHPSSNQPVITRRVERVLANVFNSEDAVFIRGSGTGAIREALASAIKPGGKLLVHTSEIYSTTQTTIEILGYEIVRADFNDLSKLRQTLESEELDACLIQYTRQEIEDSYDMSELISLVKDLRPNLPIITDDNYAVMKVSKIGSELGADMSCFSMFKLLGPEGVGLVVGKKEYLEKIRKFHYSGGSQVQGPEAMDALRSLVYAPVMLAIQSLEIEKISKKINSGEFEEIEKAVIANAQSKVVLVKFKEPIAKKVLIKSVELGAAPYPVGSESRYEFVPMFYRLSGTMRRADKEFEDYWIRINPMRAGADTVLRILDEAIKRVKDVSK